MTNRKKLEIIDHRVEQNSRQEAWSHRKHFCPRKHVSLHSPLPRQRHPLANVIMSVSSSCSRRQKEAGAGILHRSCARTPACVHMAIFSAFVPCESLRTPLVHSQSIAPFLADPHHPTCAKAGRRRTSQYARRRKYRQKPRWKPARRRRGHPSEQCTAQSSVRVGRQAVRVQAAEWALHAAPSACPAPRSCCLTRPPQRQSAFPLPVPLHCHPPHL